MEEPRKFHIDPFLALLLAALACFGACVWSAKFYPKLAVIGSAILFLGLGVLCLGLKEVLGRDGVAYGVMLLFASVALFLVGIFLL